MASRIPLRIQKPVTHYGPCEEEHRIEESSQSRLQTYTALYIFPAFMLAFSIQFCTGNGSLSFILWVCLFAFFLEFKKGNKCCPLSLGILVTQHGQGPHPSAGKLSLNHSTTREFCKFLILILVCYTILLIYNIKLQIQIQFKNFFQHPMPVFTIQ